MSIIRLKEANCKNCYRCIRECPVKSISFKEEQAQIISSDCVLCGHCLFACPQHAKEIVSDVGKVRGMINNKNRVYVSLAPSYPSYFKGISLGQMVAALKKLGVTQVEETAVGATKVSEEYERLMKEHAMRNIITTACPSVTLLVQKYYPDLLPYLAPVAPPLVAHARAMKEAYGPRIKVVFIGPCIAKKHDVEDLANEGSIAAALTFEELEAWMQQEGVTFEEEDAEQRGIRKPVARFYPVPGGIIKTISKPVRKLYKCVGIDGLDRCMKVLDSMRDGTMSDYFIEMNACVGACLGGPSLENENFFGAKDKLFVSLTQQNDAEYYMSDHLETGMHKNYIDLSSNAKEPTEEDIKKILAKIGKTRPEDELNCGGCGYPTCREKARAVFLGKAEEQMCLPYMRQKAESMSNTIIASSPNGILAMDAGLIIREANPAAAHMLGQDDLIGKHIEEVLPCDMYYDVLDDEKDNVQIGKQSYEQYHIVVDQSVVYVEESNMVIAILRDITKEEMDERKNKEMREETVEITQKVIDKQMRVAQEIASLLGETTAETKVALTRLKKSMESGEL